ncbi:MAG: hypothetical protein ACK4YO_01825 [Candidatus Altarchaeaceae archaeon]
MIDNKFIYYEYGAPTEKSIVKYKLSVASQGRVTGICASDKIFAYGNAIGNFFVYKNYEKILSENLKGAIFACDISSKDIKEKIAVCSGTQINLMNVDGNLLWSKDLNGICKNVRILDNKDIIFVTTENKLFVFSLQGEEIFSKEISVKDADANEDKGVIATDDGIYVYDNELSKISDKNVDKISSSNEFIAAISKNKFIIMDYKGKEIFVHEIPKNSNFIAIDSDENYAVALTNITSPNFIVYSKRRNELIIEENVGDESSKAIKISLNSGKLVEGYSTDYVRYLDVAGKEAKIFIDEALKLIKEMKKIGAKEDEIDEISKRITNMNTSFNNREYKNIFDFGESIKEKVTNIKSNYASAAKQEAENIIALASKYGLPTTTKIKLKYDEALKKYYEKDYVNAKKEFEEVVRQTDAYIRDKALEKYEDLMKKKEAMDKYGYAEENISKMADEISKLKEHVVGSVLFEKVDEFAEEINKKYDEIFKETKDAIEEADKVEIFSKADISEVEEMYNEAKVFCYEKKDYDQCIRKLSEAAKKAKDLKATAYAKDIVIILIVVIGIIIIIILILKPKVKKE